MKKILGIIFTLMVALVLTSCNVHLHTFSEKWSSDESSHWHQATCEHTNEVSGRADHTWDGGVVTLEPTEDAEGEKTFTCTVCEYKKIEKIEQLSHEHKWVAATCTTPKTCSSCNVTEGEALGHSWVDADCDTPKTCSVCNATEGEALGHSWVDADCDTPKTCSVCNATEGEALGHSWVDADCDTPKTCSSCNVTEGEALGHKFIDGSCACGEEYVAPASKWTLVTKLNDGDKVLIGAPAYGKLLSAEKVSAGSYYNKGVNYDYENDDFANVTDAEIFVVTVNSDGTYTFTSLTGKVIAMAASYSSLNDTGIHKSWELVDKGEGLFLLKNTGRSGYCLEWYSSKGNWSTYTAANTNEYELSFYAQVESIDENHVHNHISSVHAPTCEEDGYTSYTCKCGDTYTEAGDTATGHQYSSVVTAPTCTEAGYTTFTCTCGKSYTEAGEAATGHTEVVDAAVAADCVNTGLKEGKHCSVCNAVIVAQEVVPALGHTEVVDSAVAADCVNTGLKEGKHCSVCNTVIVAQEVVPALGHDTTAHYAIVDGKLVSVEECSRCDYTNSTEVDTTKAVEVKSADDLVLVLGMANNVVLTESVDLETAIVITKDAELTIAEGVEVTVKNDTAGDGVFHVKNNATLTINGEGTVNGVGNNKYNMVIWADGGHVVINGGTYTNVGATGEDPEHYDLIYVKNGGSVTINGGTFIAQTPQWTLNLNDAAGAGTFVVKGGTFYGYNPANSQTEPAGANNNFVAEGYHSVLVEGSYVVGAHEEVVDKAVEPTCTDTGLTEGSHCSVCNEVLVAQQTVDALGHKWVEKTTEPTFMVEGERYQECSVCGETATLEVLPVKAVETNIDGEKDDFYDGITAYTGKRTGPIVTHESYVRLGEKGIYVYQIITDGKGIIADTTHVELFFTIGDTAVADNSFAVHVYPSSKNPLRSYTFDSTSMSGRKDHLAKEYCNYAVKIIDAESSPASYAVELFVSYDYFGLTEAPESIKMQFGAGSGNPLANTAAGTVDYKTISKFYTVQNPEIYVDAKKDAKYDSLTPLKVEKGTARSDLGHESYIYFGEKGIYAYHLSTDKTDLGASTHVEWYFTLGEDAVLDNSFSAHIYIMDSDKAPHLRTYKYSSSGQSGDNSLGNTYCKYSYKLVSTEGVWKTYAYELFVDYSYFGLTEAPESMKIQIKSVQGKSGPLTNTASGNATFKDIANHLTFDKNGLVA